VNLCGSVRRRAGGQWLQRRGHEPARDARRRPRPHRIHDVGLLRERHDWPGLAGIVVVESARELGGEAERETRYYITSLTAPAETIGAMIRDRWATENSLHWAMDMVFRDDECRVRTETPRPTSSRSSTWPPI
jgi:hypothetical protein